MKFRKKPVVVEAHRWFKNGDHLQVRYYPNPDIEGYHLCRTCAYDITAHGWIDTLEGGHIVCPGDWIICGIKGEYYPCKHDIFVASYDEV